MSFALTKRQYLDGSKTVTRRMGWLYALAGQEIMGVEKAQGLKLGEKQVMLGLATILDVRRERLDVITAEDCVREGFPELTPEGFVLMFARVNRCKPSTVITRIEFERHP